MRRHTRGLAAAVAIASVSVAGCSQVAQLRPVAGDSVIAVRTATIDAVLASGASFRSAPLCTFEGTDYTCEGITADGQAVLGSGAEVDRDEVPAEFAEAVPEWATPADSFVVLTVTIGDSVVFEGLTEAVLDDNSRTRS